MVATAKLSFVWSVFFAIFRHSKLHTQSPTSDPTTYFYKQWKNKVKRLSRKLSQKSRLSQQMCVHLLGVLLCLFFISSDFSISVFPITSLPQFLSTLLLISSVTSLVLLVGYWSILTNINLARRKMTTLLRFFTISLVQYDQREAWCRAPFFRFR